MAKEPKTWEKYEEVACYLLGEMGDALGLRLASVEGKQTLVGESGAEWEIDGKGVKADGAGIVVVECRRYTTSKVKQGAVAQLAWTISDLGASGGIVVTPIGVQKGGQLIARSAGIQIVHLDADSSTTAYVLKFLRDVLIGVPAAGATARAIAPEVKVTPPTPPSND